jgi:uncharacterized protein (DUF2336 family)
MAIRPASSPTAAQSTRSASDRTTRNSLMRIVERHGDDAALREALLARSDLPVDVRQAGDEPREVGAVRALGEAERRALPRLPGDPLAALGREPRPASSPRA